MAKEKTELAKKESAEVSTELRKSWGPSGVDDRDILVPKILLMQGLSELVAQGKANQGEIVRSTTGEVLAKKDGAVEVIPIRTFKTWGLSEKIGQKFEYRGIEAMTLENMDAPFEWEQNGTTWRRDRRLNFYVLVPADIEREMEALRKMSVGDLPDPDDCLLPCVLTFQRTGYSVGKELATHFKKAEHFGCPPAVTTFKVGSRIEKNDKGTFHVFTLTKAGKTSTQHLEVCKKWHDTLGKVRVVVDEKEDAAPDDGAPPVGAENVSNNF
jgi:hypothetical protein